MRIDVKKLDIKPEGSWLKRKLTDQQFKRTIIAILIGAIVGFGYFYISEGKNMVKMPFSDIFRSIAIGAFFGFFITNSPCARGRC